MFRKAYKCSRFLANMMKTGNPHFRNDRGSTRVRAEQNGVGWFSTRNLFDTELEDIYTNIVPNASSANQRAFIRNYETELLMTNQTSCNVFVKIFEVTCRQDYASSGSSPNGFALNLPQGLIDQGINQIDSSAGALSLNYTPFQSPSFTQMWKVDKIYDIELEPGRSHRHVSVFKPYHVINENRITLGDNYRNLTRCIMVQLKGSPVCSVLDDTQVAMSEAELSLVAFRRVRLHYFYSHITTGRTTGTLPVIATTENIQEDGDLANTITA